MATNHNPAKINIDAVVRYSPERIAHLCTGKGSPPSSPTIATSVIRRPSGSVISRRSDSLLGTGGTETLGEGNTNALISASAFAETIEGLRFVALALRRQNRELTNVPIALL